MKRTLAKLVMVASVAAFTGCDNEFPKEPKNMVTRECAIAAPYTSLEVSHAFNVVMSDTVATATVAVDSSMLDRLLFTVKDGTLKIGFKHGVGQNHFAAYAMLPANATLREIDLSGASSFTSDVSLAATDIDISGASKIDVDIEASSLEIDVSGTSSATLSGNVTKLEADVSGASALNAKGLAAEVVEAEISGTSSAEVTCCQSIEADVSGCSSLTYSTTSASCNPTEKVSTSGASTATRL